MVLAYVHAGLMPLAFGLLFAGFLTARYLRQRRSWLRVHRAFGLSGAGCMILGLAAMVVQIALNRGDHLDVPHAWVGCVVAALVLGVAVVGLLQLRVRQGGASLRLVHRPLGRIAIALMAANILLGLKAAGII